MANIPDRLKKTRIVTFNEDYKAGGKTIYKKGSTHPIHEKTAEKLKEGGAKVKIEKYDAETEIEKAKTKFEKTRKEELAGGK